MQNSQKIDAARRNRTVVGNVAAGWLFGVTDRQSRRDRRHGGLAVKPVAASRSGASVNTSYTATMELSTKHMSTPVTASTKTCEFEFGIDIFPTGPSELVVVHCPELKELLQ